MTVRTLCDIFRHSVLEHDRPRAAGLASDPARPPTWVPSSQIASCVEHLFHFWVSCGVRPGDRALLWLRNRPEWAMADFSLLAAGAIDVPIYLTLAASDVRTILENCRPRLAVVDDADLEARLLEAAGGDLRPEVVVRFEEPGCQGERTIPWREALVAGERSGGTEGRRNFEAALTRARPDDVATLIYTSGTTGTPKGVALTHSNLVSNVLSCLKIIDLGADDVALSFLPLCHVYERMLDYCYWLRRAGVVYVGDPRTAGDFLPCVRPTALGAVPRFYEKVIERIEARRRGLGPLPRRLFDWALRTGHEWNSWREQTGAVPPGLRLRHRLAGLLVYRRIHRALGGNLRLLISGGAALAKEVADTLWALDLRVLQGYGLSETSPVITLNPPGRNRNGTAGPPIPGTQVRIADDGEILVRGPGVMKEYFRSPEATRETMVEGWLATGDVGALDADGYLTVTDRKKELLVTSGGKNIAPSPIETRLERNPIIAQTMLIGNDRKFLSALIVPDFNALREEAKALGVTAHDRESLIEHPRILQLYQDRIDQLLAGWARFKQVRRFTLLANEWTPESGEVTPTLKIRRRVLLERYREQIELMYKETAGDPAATRHEA